MTKDTIKFIIDSALTGRRDREFLSRESLQNTRCGKEDERTFMNFLNKMERKFGRYAIHNLSTYIIGAYVIGYFLYFLAPGVLYNYLAVLYLKRADLETDHLGFNSAGITWYFYDHHADAVLFSWQFTGADLGGVPV